MNLNNIPKLLEHLDRKYQAGGHKHPAFRFQIFGDGSGAIEFRDNDGDLTRWAGWGGNRNGPMEIVLFERMLEEL